MRKSIIKEFKEFAVKGNVIDLAVGVVIGTAFGKIVSSLVNDIIMPVVGILIGGVDFTKLVVKVDGVNGKEVLIKYGQFIQSVVDFLIISFSIFLFINIINKFKKKEEEKPNVVEPTKEEILLTEIRDILKEKSDIE
ncbi:large-conductance mechanosensitive channel protein MscL [Clostridium lundense]|uniref:large-conductance mechanosensitive channel protein MscL n=1 Tax=Clostridium lundense TaxID=319475 RepID=UPI0005565D65|nr:large-conductance mechanosensitive channel protein MscL [Clostridium lundense]